MSPAVRSPGGFSRWLEGQWERLTPWHLLLLPLAVLFGLLAALRRSFYRWGLLPITRLSVPVIVVGNIAVGGTGKTPLVIALARLLREAGYQPGIISRGHGGRQRQPAPVGPEADPAEVGDEPVLLARRAGCPVWVGRARGKVAQAMLAAHPEVDVLLSDDGLQHYALARDVEIAVVDAQRWLGNGQLLPAGPLREPGWRLQTVDCVVINGWLASAPLKRNEFTMRLVGDLLYNLRNPLLKARPEVFAGQTVWAMAGIGNPQRFFDHLRRLGLRIVPRAFADHHPFTLADLAQAGEAPIVMTEKDAVKCAAFAGDNVWVLPVVAELDPRLGPAVLDRLAQRKANAAGHTESGNANAP